MRSAEPANSTSSEITDVGDPATTRLYRHPPLDTAVLPPLPAPAADQQWAWRVPFLCSAVLVVVGMWIRLGVAVAANTLAAYFFHVDCALRVQRLYVFFVLEVGPRYLHVLGVTPHPDGCWTTR
jgi:hypothetical protein